MGQRTSSAGEHMLDRKVEATIQGGYSVSCYFSAWDLVVSGTLEYWQRVAHSYGFADSPYGCVDKECDRDAVCLKLVRVLLREKSNSIEIIRYKQPTHVISYASNTDLCQKVNKGFQLSEMIAAMRDSHVLLIFYRWEKLQYDAVFVLLDLEQQRVVGHFESPTINMSIMECKISPDKSKVIILFYFRKDNESPFQYDLYVVCSLTFDVLDIIRCNTEVRPYVTFDPRYRSSRVAIVNFRNPSDGKDGLVIYCIESKKVIAISDVMRSIVYGGGYFCVNFSKDGHFLILQKINENIHGGKCSADSYIFTANNLRLVRHFFANLQRFSTFCDINYAPMFSQCGSRMCISCEETTCHQRQMLISVYQMPWPISLQEQCRITVLQNLNTPQDVDVLPLPRKLKQFLHFSPEL